MSSMRIKRALPPAPEPTRPKRTNSYTSDEGNVVLFNPSPISTVADIGRHITEKSIQNAHKNSRITHTANAHEKWERMAKMAGDGWSDREIAEAVGYTEKYVRERLKRMRRSGIKIPERQRGRKANG